MLDVHNKLQYKSHMFFVVHLYSLEMCMYQVLITKHDFAHTFEKKLMKLLFFNSSKSDLLKRKNIGYNNHMSLAVYIFEITCNNS